MKDPFTVRHSTEKGADTSVPDSHQDTFSKNTLGFWIYLMTDCVLFASLFITYAVLHRNTFGGPSPSELFDLRIPFIQTMTLLLSSLFCASAVVAAKRNRKDWLMGLLVATVLLGTLFVATELAEFTHLVNEGNSWRRSAFLSSYFTLVGTHGVHISAGIFWGIVLLAQVASKGLTTDTFRRTVIFSFFWHFLELIWIFLFTFVYLMGGVY